MLSRVRFLSIPFAAASVFAAMAQPASAGIWTWGCMGKLGQDQVIFNRNSLIVTAEKLPRITLRDLTSSSREFEAKEGLTFDNLGSNDGLKQTMRFKINGTSERKLTLIETSSRTTFHRQGHVGKREEETTKFLKTFRYAFDKEPERIIKMQCIEYQLSTCGGPCS